jgi:hypothetical protein
LLNKQTQNIGHCSKYMGIKIASKGIIKISKNRKSYSVKNK